MLTADPRQRATSIGRIAAVPQRAWETPSCSGMAPNRHSMRSTARPARTRGHEALPSRRSSDAVAGGRDERALGSAAQQLDFARWFADWWLRRGRQLATEEERQRHG